MSLSEFGKQYFARLAAETTGAELDRTDEYVETFGDIDGARLLDDLEGWFARFIRPTFDGDLAVLALWAVHTHLVTELRTTPRLQLDSSMPGSGKTTVLDHFSRLCYKPILMASAPSAALIPRALETSMRTLLFDEVDRTLRPDAPATSDVIPIINSGYRFGAHRPVLLPVKGGGWDLAEMSTYAPVALSGNAPNLADDTKSRTMRILLMPDIDGRVEDSDWEIIEDDANALHDRIADFAESVRDQVKGMQVDLPAGCIGRSKEKWRPLKRVALAAGGRWPSVTDTLIERDLAELAAERDAGLRTLPPGMVLVTDLFHVWPDTEELVPTVDLVAKLIEYNADYWGPHSAYGKALTEKRFGKLLGQAAKVTSQRPGGRGPRGFFRHQLTQAWTRISPFIAGASGYPGSPGTNDAAYASLTACTGPKGGCTGSEPTLFKPPTGPGRCTECGFHVATQGHGDNCSAKQFGESA